MTYKELEDLARNGKLKIEKTEVGTRYRTRLKWNKEISNYEDTECSYRVFRYSARTEDMPKYQSYKITSKDYWTFKDIMGI